MKKITTVYQTFIIATAIALMACGEAVQEKPKYMWFDAEANFERFSYKDSITYYMDKAVEAGFNQIAVDARPVHGAVLYNSEFLPSLTVINGFDSGRDWDYLAFFVEEAHKRNLKITVSTTVFPLGMPDHMDGIVYDDDSYDERLCIEYLPEGMMNIKEDTSKVAAFLIPSMEENQQFALRFIREIVENYDIDGYALDYCRYPSFESDFSDSSRKAFEEYIGEKVENFPADIFTYTADGGRTPGKHYKKWWEWRSMVIHDFVKRAKEEIRSIKPHVELELWAPSWLNSLYNNGQNWASKRHNYLDTPGNEDWATPEYSQTGFAEHLDIFLLGTYLEVIYGKDNEESIEYGIARANNAIKGDCKVFGTIYAKNHATNIEDAAYVCLMQSEGLMVFDIVQVIEFNTWDALKRGIDRAERELKEAAKKRQP